MRVHICLYLDDDEVLNINDVISLEFFGDNKYLHIVSEYREFLIYYTHFDRIEVNYI